MQDAHGLKGPQWSISITEPLGNTHEWLTQEIILCSYQTVRCGVFGDYQAAHATKLCAWGAACARQLSQDPKQTSSHGPTAPFRSSGHQTNDRDSRNQTTFVPDSYCLAETTLVTYALMAFPKLQDVRWRHCLLKLCSISNEDTSRLTPPCYHISIGTLMQFVSNMIIRKHPGMTWVCIYMQMGVHFTYVHRCWVAIFSV